MADKKIVTLDQLKTYDTKVKEKLNEKLDKNGDQVLNGNLTLTGDLNVQGTTNTVNQETLTVKDNLIAINSDGTTLAASGKAGIVIVDGKERSFLISDYYEFDVEAFFNFVNPKVVNISTDPDKAIYRLETYLDPFNSISLTPTELKFQNGNNIIDSFGQFFIGALPGSYNNTISLHIVTNGAKTSSKILGSIIFDENLGTYSIVDNKTQFLLSSTILSDKNIDDLSHFLKHSSSQKYINEENIKKEATAYAAPIYDVETDSLKLGLGTFTRDENGNIIDFVFGENQDQSIATRSNVFNNEYHAVPYWDPEKQCFTANPDNDGMYAFMDGKGLGGLMQLHANYIDISRGMGQVIYSEDLGDEKGVLVLENRHSQVKFYREDMVTGEPAKLIIDGKQVATLDDIETQSIDINLKNGTGTDSIVQKVSTIDPTDPTDFENTATADSGVTFGKSNTNTGKRTFVIGKGNTNNGANNVVGGNSNNISEQGLNSFVGGYKNTVTAGSGIVVGQNNNNNGKYSIVSGNINTNNATDSLVVGQDNKNDGDRSIVGGLENENTGKSAIIGGFGNINNTDDALVVGHYNLPVEDALLVVGNGVWKQGDAEPTRSNAFEVLKDGTIKCNGKPLGTNSITPDTDQIISGKKTFQDEVVIGNIDRPVEEMNGPIDACGRLKIASLGGTVKIGANEDSDAYQPIINMVDSGGTLSINTEGINKNNALLTYPEEGGTIATEEKLEGKLDKVPSQETGNIFFQVYGTKRKNGQAMFNVQAGDAVFGNEWIPTFRYKQTSGTLDTNYALTTTTPLNPYQCANKLYVDTALDGKIDAENIDDYPEYDSETTYNAGSIVKSNGVLYGSLKASNKGNPLTDTEWWAKTPLLVLPPVSTLYNTTYLVGVNGTTKRVEQMSMQNASADGSTRPGAFTVMRTGANGVFTVGDPVGQYHATNKIYVDTALEGKVDKVTNAVYYNRVYGIDGNGNQTVFGMGFEPYQYRLAQYMPPGTVGEGVGKFNAILKVGTPIIGNDATNKDYVDKGMWLPAYDETVTYAKDVMVVKDGKIYKSLIDSNTGNALTDTASWQDLLSGKVDTNNGSYKIYGTAWNGLQKVYSVGNTSGNSANQSIPWYFVVDASELDKAAKGSLITATPQKPYAAANKLYVDTNFVGLRGDQTIEGQKTFATEIYVGDPNTETDIVNITREGVLMYDGSYGGVQYAALGIRFINSNAEESLLMFPSNTSGTIATIQQVNDKVGDIESALDSINEILNSLIGGNE